MPKRRSASGAAKAKEAEGDVVPSGKRGIIDKVDLKDNSLLKEAAINNSLAKTSSSTGSTSPPTSSTKTSPVSSPATKKRNSSQLVVTTTSNSPSTNRKSNNVDKNSKASSSTSKEKTATADDDVDDDDDVSTDGKSIAYDQECWDELIREYWVQGVETPDELLADKEHVSSESQKNKNGNRKSSGTGTSGSNSNSALNTNPDKPERHYPDSWQMNFWNRYFGWLLFNNGIIGKIIGFIFVTPLTNVTGLSLYYQLYLNEIFHTKFMTRLGHFTFMPIIDFFIIAFLCQFRAPFWEPYPPHQAVEPFIWNLGVVLAIYFVLWYLVWGVSQKTYMFGVWMIPAMTAMALAANVYYTYFRWNDGNEHPWYEPTPFYANPLLWIVVGGAGQSGSHVFEPNIPPRVNHTAHWIPLVDFIKNGIKEHKVMMVILTVVGSFTFGVMDEIVASPRLLPLNMLKILYMLGYKPDQWTQIQKLAKWSMEYGNPALDFIGRGGALHPPATYEDAKRKFAKYDKVLTVKEKEDALAITDVDSAKLNDKKYRQEVKYKLLKLLIAQAKLQKYAFGPFVRNTPAGNRIAQTLEARKKQEHPEDAFHAFLSQAREDIWAVAQKRRQERVDGKFKKFVDKPKTK